jgi:outer membrane protein
LYDRSTNIAVDQARNEASIANLEHLIEKQRLLLRVCNAYFSVLAARDDVELSTSNQRAIRRQLELAEERLAVGVGTRTDLYDARARFENAIASGIESEKTVRDARQALVALVDEDLSDLQPLRTDVPLAAPEPNAVEHWVEAALTDNLALRQSALRVYVAEQDISRQQAARFPVLSLNLNGGLDYSSTASDRTSLSVGLSVPLYEGDLVGARVRQAALRHNAVRADLEAHQREVRRLTRNAFFTVNSHLRRVSALAESVRAGENALKAKEEGFAAGLTTNIDVLDAQRDVFAAKRNYLKARYDYILQVLALEQLAGRLDQADLDRFNQWLE